MEIEFYGDVLEKILSFLPWREVISCQLVSSQWLAASRRAPINEEFSVGSENLAERLREIATSVPNIRRLKVENGAIEYLNRDDRFSEALSFWPQLSHLQCMHLSNLHSSFSGITNLKQLVSLELYGNERLEWKLSDLNTLTHLRRLVCVNHRLATGDTSDLTSLSFEVVGLSGCEQITGLLMDFATMPNLHTLFLDRTEVKGDVRHIRSDHFPKIRRTGLPNGVYGANELEQVGHASDVMRGRHRLVRNALSDDTPIFPFRVSLSPESPDYHERVEQRLYSSERDPPFNIEFVHIGPRAGWRWSNYLGGYCDIHWLDPAPDQSSARYAEYIEALDRVGESIFSGFLDPPTREEYLTLRRELQASSWV